MFCKDFLYVSNLFISFLTLSLRPDCGTKDSSAKGNIRTPYQSASSLADCSTSCLAPCCLLSSGRQQKTASGHGSMPPDCKTNLKLLLPGLHSCCSCLRSKSIDESSLPLTPSLCHSAFEINIFKILLSLLLKIQHLNV